jgi:hypothetical protein
MKALYDLSDRSSLVEPIIAVEKRGTRVLLLSGVAMRKLGPPRSQVKPPNILKQPCVMTAKYDGGRDLGRQTSEETPASLAAQSDTFRNTTH